jgi:hypothetical protein
MSLPNGGFLNSPAGWYCRMRDSLNFDLIRQEITPWPTLDISEEYDTILDKSTWCAILGPDASGHI